MAEIADAGLSGRRDFLVQVAGAFVGVGSAVALWPFIDQMNPNNASPRDATEVDLRAIQPGQMISVVWRGKLVFIRNRTREEVELARNARIAELPDRLARNEALPEKSLAHDSNRTKEGHDNWLVVVGLCTHLGCQLTAGQPAASVGSGEGWFCPCHAARFDLSGRVRVGPARTNLPVPPYRFLTPTKISIG
jgi:ubiquinol-cytochrome c reductase iron-sulfur subunit